MGSPAPAAPASGASLCRFRGMRQVLDSLRPLRPLAFARRGGARELRGSYPMNTRMDKAVDHERKGLVKEGAVAG